MTAGGPRSTDFEEYVQRGTSLLRFAFLLCHDRHLAEDLVQEALARAYRSWHRIQDVDHPDLYVRRIVLNQLLSWRRRRGWGSEISAERLPERDLTPGDVTAGADRDALWALVAGLPPRQRAVIVLRFYEDLPDAQIAQVLGCSTVTVRSHASKALSHLRRDADADLIRGDR